MLKASFPPATLLFRPQGEILDPSHPFGMTTRSQDIGTQSTGRENLFPTSVKYLVGMNYQSCEVSKNIYDSFPEGVTPECLNRGSSHGSTLLTMTLSSGRMGQSLTWIPATSMREMTDLR